MATISKVRPDDVYELDPKGDVILLLAVPHDEQEGSEPDSDQEEEERPAPLFAEDAAVAEAVEAAAAAEAIELSPDFYTPLPEAEPEPPIEATPDWPTADESAPPDEYPEEPEEPADAPPPEPEPEPSHEYPDESAESPPSEPSPEPKNGWGQSPSASPSPSPEPKPHTIRILVSSSILRLASPHLAALISSSSAAHAHHPLELDFTTTLPSSPHAFVTLLNIFHFRTSRVPRAVSLEELTQLARLVDRFGCHEAVGLFADDWIRGLQHTLPTDADGFSDDVCRWMCVAWVFRREREFRIATRVAQRCACEPLECGDEGRYPVPKAEIDHINKTRTRALAALLRTLTDLLSTHQNSSSPPRCGDACDSMVLGALTRRMQARGILEASRRYPYVSLLDAPDDFSVRGLAAWVRGLELPSVHDMPGGGVDSAMLAPPALEPEQTPVEEGEVPMDEGVVEVEAPPEPPAPPADDDWGVWGTSTVKKKKKTGRKAGWRNRVYVDDSSPPLYDEAPPPAPELWVGDGRACDPLAETKARVAEIAAGLRGLDIGA